MATASTLDAPVQTDEERNRGRNTLATVVVAGHAVKHLYLAGLQSILMPEIKIAFGLNGAQVGTLATVRQFSGWATTIGSGFLGDRFAAKTGLMLAISLSMMGAAFFLVGMSESYLMLFGALLLAGIGPSMYHPPAIGALSRRFPDKRAFAISLHGSGGSLGEVLGPVTAAGLLTFLTWQGILQVSFLPAFICAFLVWRVMGSLEFADGGGSTLRAYFQSLAVMLKTRALALLVLITALRSMGQSSISLFLPIYLREDLDYSAATVGVFLAMAQLIGIGSQPIMGYFSDRVGHKRVLVPAMLCLGALFAALAFVEGDLGLGLTILALGAFLYSLHSIFISAAIGVVGESGQSTVVSVMYGASFLGILSPIIAGVIVDETQTQNAFIYGAVMVFLGALVLAAMRLPRGESVAHMH